VSGDAASGGCAAYLENHAAWMDGFLAGDAAAAHEAHARACPSCARYARVLDRGLSLVRGLPEIEPSAYFEQRLQHRIFHIEDEKLAAASAGRSLTGLAAVALIALIAWSPLAVRFISHATSSATQPTAASTDNAVTAPYANSDVAPRGDLAATVRNAQRHTWYVQPAAAELEQTPVQRLVSYEGTYSPLIVSPPAYARGPRAVRLVSATSR
jgi:hypothetical protein